MTGKSESVLVVGSNQKDQQRLVNLLQEDGFQVSIASNQQDATVLLQQAQFDLLLLDQETHHSDKDDTLVGLSLLQKLRETFSPEILPVLWILDEANSEHILQGLQAGANDYLERSSHTLLFRHRIQTLLAAKQAKEDFEENLVRYREFFENASDLLQSMTIQGKLLHVNQAWLDTLGYQKDESLHLSLEDLVHPSSFAACWKSFQDVLADESIGKLEAIFVTKNGEEITVEGSLSCQWLEGQPHAVHGIFRDITERKKVDHLKNEFVSIVSHELRTPMTAIVGSLGLIASGTTGQLAPKAKILVDIAHRNSERLVRLINDILDMEKIESGKMDFSMRIQPLAGILESAVEANRAYGMQYNVQFILQDPLPAVQVNADKDRLMQVMNNLLSNAAKFSPRNGKVMVDLDLYPDVCRISVTDHGKGIPKAFHKRIFQKFAQVDSSATREKDGTGLGLSIAKAIIEKHGGQIGFFTREDVGTTFYFDLPNWEKISRIRKHAPKTSSPRILICEDQAEIAFLLKNMLEREGFDIDLAYSAKEARELLNKNKYNAITMDLILDGPEDGLSLIREIREREETRQIPIVIISAIATEGKSQLNGDVIGVVDWLDKPIDRKRLLSSVQHAIRRKDLRRPCVLYIEDDVDLISIISHLLEDTADVEYATTLSEAKQKLRQKPYDLLLLDLELPDGSGSELLPFIKSQTPNPAPIILFSGNTIDQQTAQQVNAALLKASTSNQTLLQTITQLITNYQSSSKKTLQ